MGHYPQLEKHLLEMLILQMRTLSPISSTSRSVCIESQDQGDLSLKAALQQVSVLMCLPQMLRHGYKRRAKLAVEQWLG